MDCQLQCNSSAKLIVPHGFQTCLHKNLRQFLLRASFKPYLFTKLEMNVALKTSASLVTLQYQLNKQIPSVAIMW